MLKNLIFLTAFAVTVVCAPGFARAGEARPQQLCPITGTDLATVAKPLPVEIDGFRFFVADEAARGRAIQDPATAFAALSRNRDAAEPVSEVCPIMGNRINRTLFTERDGRRVFICCRGCTKRLEKNWSAALTKLAEQARVGDPETITEM